MRRLFIWPWFSGSNGARVLRDKMIQVNNEFREIRLLRGSYQTQVNLLSYRDHPVIINWGNTRHFPRISVYSYFVNKPSRVKMASDKAQFFRQFSGPMEENPDPEVARKIQDIRPHIPWFTDNPISAEEKLDRGSTLVARTQRTGSGGRGILIITDPDEVRSNSLFAFFTEYIKKKHEYRIHVVNGDKLVQQKRRTHAVADEDVNWQVRNWDNGFIYAVNNIDPMPPMSIRRRCGYLVHDILGLTFGAVDVIYNEYYDAWYILEVNTAPGLESETVAEFYTNHLLRQLWEEYYGDAG